MGEVEHVKATAIGGKLKGGSKAVGVSLALERSRQRSSE